MKDRTPGGPLPPEAVYRAVTGIEFLHVVKGEKAPAPARDSYPPYPKGTVLRCGDLYPAVPTVTTLVSHQAAEELFDRYSGIFSDGEGIPFPCVKCLFPGVPLEDRRGGALVDTYNRTGVLVYDRSMFYGICREHNARLLKADAQRAIRAAEGPAR